MQIKDVIKIIDERIKMLYDIKKKETDNEELLKLEGKISELVHLEATIEMIEKNL